MPYELLDEPEAQEEGLGKYVGRNLARAGTRAAEAVAGLPGDILGGGINLLSAATGGKTPTYQQLEEKDKAKGVPDWLRLPTSERFHELTKSDKNAGEYLEPKTSNEEGLDEIIGDATRFFLGGAKALPSLGLSTAGNFAKWGTESLTGSPLAGGVAKLGTTLLAGTLGTRRELNDLKKKSYETAFKKLPENKRFNFSPEAQTIDKTIRKVSRGTFPDKQEVVSRLSDVKNIIGDEGNALVSEIVGAKQGLNEYLREHGSKLAPSAKREIQDAVGSLNSGIARYGKTNPSFFKPYKVGEELTAGMNSINYVGEFISKHPALRKKIDNPFLGSLFKYGIGASSGGIISQYPLQTGAAVGGLYGAHQLAKTIKLFAKSPIAQQAYADAMKNGLKGNVANFSRDLTKLEREYEKHYDDLEGQYELLD